MALSPRLLPVRRRHHGITEFGQRGRRPSTVGGLAAIGQTRPAAGALSSASVWCHGAEHWRAGHGLV